MTSSPEGGSFTLVFEHPMAKTPSSMDETVFTVYGSGSMVNIAEGKMRILASGSNVSDLHRALL